MKTSEQGLALIRQCEGFSARPYFCPAGKSTIGYGHVIQPGEKYPANVIDTACAEKLLAKDVQVTEQAINRLVTCPVTQNQFDALVSFIYNVGISAFEKSTLLHFLNTQNPHASQEFERWVYINGGLSPGLARRRAMETALFRQ